MKALLVAVGVIVAGLMLVAPPAHAIVYEFFSDHCTGTCGTPPFGSVTLIDNGTGVDVTVDLYGTNKFVKTGAGDLMAFKFNSTGVVAGDITIDPHTPALALFTGPVDGDGTGLFDWGIWCPTCNNGGSGAFANDIVFHVADAEISDLVVGNVLGIVFVADILGENGNTGPVDVTGNGGGGGGQAPVPATLALLGAGLMAATGLGSAWGFRRKK